MLFVLLSENKYDGDNRLFLMETSTANLRGTWAQRDLTVVVSVHLNLASTVLFSSTPRSTNNLVGTDELLQAASKWTVIKHL